jgi:hypothetical protein
MKQEQPKTNKELENYLSTLNPDALKFINSKRMIQLCNRVIKKNKDSDLIDVITRDVMIEKYGILLKTRMIRLFLENKNFKFNKRLPQSKKTKRKIKTNENIFSIKL